MKRHLGVSLSKFEKLLRKCSGKRLAYDTETTGLSSFHNHVISMAVHCPDAGIEFCADVGFAVEDENDPRVLEFEKELHRIVGCSIAPGTTLIAHNSKFDMAFAGISPEACQGYTIVDTPVMIHLLDPRNKEGLEMAEKLLLGTNSKRQHVAEAPVVELKNKKGTVTKRKTAKVWLWPSELRMLYNLNDAVVTYQLAETIYPILKKREMEWLFREQMQYLKLVYKTEHIGIVINPEFVGNAISLLLSHLKDMEQLLYDAVGYEFNWKSTMQLSKAIYQNLGIEMPVDPFAFKGNNQSGEYIDADGFKRQRIIKGGAYNKTNTSTFILMEKVKHPLGALISTIRESAKLAKTMSSWLELMDENNVIHTDFNLTGTRTGRLSSKKPPIQNIPSDVRGRFTQGVFTGGINRSNEYNLRNALEARPGYSMLSIDYKTMEMVFFGQTSQDESLLRFIANGQDIHGSIAQKVWGDCGKDLNKIHREWSKTISFSLLYGMTAGSLQHKLNMTFAEAKKLTDDYWGEFPRIRPWLRERMFECRDFGYVKYWSGRRWYEETENFYYRGANAVIQGGCADMLGVAALRCDKWLRQQTFDGHIVSFIHDELLFEIETPYIEQCADALSEIMKVPDVLGLPFKTECKVGSTYGDLQDMRKTDGKLKFVDKSEVY